MRVTVLRNISPVKVKELNLAAVYTEGQAVDLPQADFDTLLALGLCEPEGVHAVASPSPKASKAKTNEETK